MWNEDIYKYFSYILVQQVLRVVFCFKLFHELLFLNRRGIEMKTPLNVLIQPETERALVKAKNETNKTLSTFVEDAILYYLKDLGITVDLEGEL